MQEVFTIDLDGVNCFLGKEDGQFVLFDTGGHLALDKTFDNRYTTLKKKLQEHGCTPDNLNLIVLTHGDIDHVGNALKLKNDFHAKIAMHEDDRVLVEKPTLELLMKSFHYKSVIFKLVFKLMKKHFVKATSQALNDYESFIPDIFLNDGDTLDAYGFHAKVMHMPGHTPGSIAVVTANNDLISGDIFANMSKPQIAVNAYDYLLLNESIEKIKPMGIHTVFVGHGKPFPFTELKM